ncbi:MAG: hypothetical protein MI717_00040, partial [Spirochaetales bacterium]|nr:hypothetical protein [Spirochaetales bacterium]
YTTLKEHGYKVGNQHAGELLLNDWQLRNFGPIAEYCRTAEAFQDVPFSLPFTFVWLDHCFPNSKFILTVRNSPEEWYNSLVSFHSKLFGGGNVPTAEQLKESDYLKRGWIYKFQKAVFSTPDEDLYNKEALIKMYDIHTSMVMRYFRFRANELLVLNLSEKDAYQRFCSFLGISQKFDSFPWENKTSDIQAE